MQNTINTFSEVCYYLNVNILIRFDHHSNIFAAAFGIETLLHSKNSGSRKGTPLAPFQDGGHHGAKVTDPRWPPFGPETPVTRWAVGESRP